MNGLSNDEGREAYRKFYDLVDRIESDDPVDVAEELEQCSTRRVAEKVEGLLFQHLAVVVKRRGDRGKG